MLDPITVSVIQYRLVGIVEEMGEAMLRTSFSQILNSSRDFSTAICGADGRLVAQAEHIPVHIGALPSAVEAVVEAFGEAVHPGDVFLLNDPYFGGSHLPDLTTFVPVFHDGHLVFWTVTRAHQSDIGGATHGAYNAAATDIWQEGLRVPPLRIHDRGQPREDVLRMLQANVRHARARWVAGWCSRASAGSARPSGRCAGSRICSGSCWHSSSSFCLWWVWFYVYLCLKSGS